ncbi:MAG: hypothetical protein WAO02_09085 [Verrucomicrobiia bacterium]
MLATPSLSPVQAQGITISVVPALAPNVYGSPNWNAWVSNATTAIANGYSSYGDPSSPSYYQWAPGVISITNDLVTGFPSWNGLADPGNVFGASFSQELGNRLQFGIDIKGGTNLISISQLAFSAHSTDPSNTLDFAFAEGSYNYSQSYVGIIYGPGGTNTYVTSGPATQLVNELVGRGSGNAWAVYDTSGDIASQQSNLVLAATQISDQPFDFTGTYTIDGVSGSNSVTLNPVAPSAGPILGTGGISISVFPALAPNRWGSPSWNAWASNAVTAILNGFSSSGDPSSPTFYQQITNAISVTNNLATSFPSWMGVADPGTAFGPAFAQELGNRLTFGMDIKGGTNLISIAQLSFIMNSTDPSNTLDWTYSPVPYAYSGLNTGSASPVYLGIIYGPNGQNTYVTNGPATQLVNEIITCGSGNAWWPDGTSADGIATQQSNILVCASQFGNQPFDFTGTYMIDGVAGSNSVSFNPVLTSSGSPSAPPTLFLMLADPPDNPTVLDNVVVSWPTSAAGFVLQTNADLTTTNWGDYTGPVNSRGGTNSVTLSKSTGSLFFRLRN